MYCIVAVDVPNVVFVVFFVCNKETEVATFWGGKVRSILMILKSTNYFDASDSFTESNSKDPNPMNLRSNNLFSYSMFHSELQY